MAFDLPTGDRTINVRHLDAMNEFYKSLPLFAIVLVLVVSSYQRQLKDNKPWRRYGSVGLGLIFIVWVIVSIITGHITAWRNNTITYFVSKDPVGFWLVVSAVILLGIGCVYRGIRGRR
jgi:hypothetical protein